MSFDETEYNLRRKIKQLEDEKAELERQLQKARYEKERGSFGGWNDE